MRAQQHIENIPGHNRDGDKQPEESERSRRVTPRFSAGGARFALGRRRRMRIGMGTCGDHCLATDDAWDGFNVLFVYQTV